MLGSLRTTSHRSNVREETERGRERGEREVLGIDWLQIDAVDKASGADLFSGVERPTAGTAAEVQHTVACDKEKCHIRNAKQMNESEKLTLANGQTIRNDWGLTQNIGKYAHI